MTHDFNEDLNEWLKTHPECQEANADISGFYHLEYNVNGRAYPRERLAIEKAIKNGFAIEVMGKLRLTPLGIQAFKLNQL